MLLQQCPHFLLELHTELLPVAPVLGVDKEGGEEIDVFNVQPAATAREQIAATVIERQLRLHKTMFVRSLPPVKISVEVALCIVEHQAPPARIMRMCDEGRREVSQNVTPQRVRPEVEPNCQECRAASTEPPG